MTPKRAFWQALGLVAIPSLVVWTVLLSIVGYYAGEWPLYLMFFLVPVLILVPIVYHSHKKYSGGSPHHVSTARQHWIFAIMGIILASLFVADVLFKRNGSNPASNLTLAFAWLCFALGHVLKVLKKKSHEAPATSAK